MGNAIDQMTGDKKQRGKGKVSSKKAKTAEPVVSAQNYAQYSQDEQDDEYDDEDYHQQRLAEHRQMHPHALITDMAPNAGILDEDSYIPQESGITKFVSSITDKIRGTRKSVPVMSLTPPNIERQRDIHAQPQKYGKQSVIPQMDVYEADEKQPSQSQNVMLTVSNTKKEKKKKKRPRSHEPIQHARPSGGNIEENKEDFLSMGHKRDHSKPSEKFSSSQSNIPAKNKGKDKKVYDNAPEEESMDIIMKHHKRISQSEIEDIKRGNKAKYKQHVESSRMGQILATFFTVVVIVIWVLLTLVRTKTNDLVKQCCVWMLVAVLSCVVLLRIFLWIGAYINKKTVERSLEIQLTNKIHNISGYEQQ